MPDNRSAPDAEEQARVMQRAYNREYRQRKKAKVNAEYNKQAKQRHYARQFDLLLLQLEQAGLQELSEQMQAATGAKLDALVDRAQAELEQLQRGGQA